MGELFRTTLIRSPTIKPKKINDPKDKISDQHLKESSNQIGFRTTNNKIDGYNVMVIFAATNHNTCTNLFFLPRQPPDEGVKPKNPGVHRLQSVVLSTPG